MSGTVSGHFSYEDLNYKEPFNVEAEQSVLAVMILDYSKMSDMLIELKPEYFYNKQNKEIFLILLKMFSINEKIDVVTVLNEVRRKQIFESDEQANIYITSLIQVVPTISNVDSYIKILEEKYLLRTLLRVSKVLTENIESGKSEAKEILEFAEQAIYDIRKDKNIEGLIRIDEIIIKTYDRLQELSLKKDNLFSGVSSGFKDLDKITSGLNKTDLILIAARPGMGKTSFALNIATNVAKNSKKSVAIFSLEMSNEQLVSRILSSEARISSMNLRNGYLASNEWQRLAKISDIIAKCPIYIDDSTNIKVIDMKAKLRRVENLGLVVIDYLQLMTSGRRTESRVQEISEITRNLKILAKELDVPVIALSQLSRAPESRQNNHRPMLSDLRDSGSIEQDADIVMFLYRESYYNKDMEEDIGLSECIVSKNRHGEVNTVKLNFNSEFTKFSSLEVFRNE